MPLHDLAQAIPGIVLVVLLPGFALATLFAPRWLAWERLAAAPGLAAGFIGVLGLTERLVHVPFEPLTVLPALAVVCVAGYVRRRAVKPGERPPAPWWLPIPALLAGVVGATVFAAALRGQVLPPDWDPRVHGALAASIARTHDVLPLFPIRLQGTAYARARPGFEAMSAVVSWVGGPAPVHSMAPIITAVLAMLPLSLAMLAFEATGSVALALVVPLVGVGLAFPSLQAIVGRYPQVTDSTLIVPFIVAAARLIRGREWAENWTLLTAATASIWVVHGLEVLSALIVGGALLVGAAIQALRRSLWPGLARVVTAAAAVGAGAVAVTLITRVPHTPSPSVLEPSVVAPQPGAVPVPWHLVVASVAQSDLTSPITVALLAIGLVVVLTRPRLWWLLVSGAAVLLALVDSLYSRHLGSAVWRNLVFPWGDEDRVLGLFYWVIPLVLGAGLLAVASVLRRLAADRRLSLGATAVAAVLVAVLIVEHGAVGRRWMAFFAATPVSVAPLGIFDHLTHLGAWSHWLAAAAAIVALSWTALATGFPVPGVARLRTQPCTGKVDAALIAVAGVAVLMLAAGAKADLSVYRGAVLTRSTATAADLTVLARMQAELRPGATVLTNGLDDAGIWVVSLTDLRPLVPNGYERGALSQPLVDALAHACQDPAAAADAVRRANAVFVGSHHIVAGGLAPWDEACISRLPDVRLIASAAAPGGVAAGFAVTP